MKLISPGETNSGRLDTDVVLLNNIQIKRILKKKTAVQNWTSCVIYSQLASMLTEFTTDFDYWQVVLKIIIVI